MQMYAASHSLWKDEVCGKPTTNGRAGFLFQGGPEVGRMGVFTLRVVNTCKCMVDVMSIWPGINVMRDVGRSSSPGGAVRGMPPSGTEVHGNLGINVKVVAVPLRAKEMCVCGR